MANAQVFPGIPVGLEGSEGIPEGYVPTIWVVFEAFDFEPFEDFFYCGFGERCVVLVEGRHFTFVWVIGRVETREADAEVVGALVEEGEEGFVYCAHINHSDGFEVGKAINGAEVFCDENFAFVTHCNNFLFILAK